MAKKTDTKPKTPFQQDKRDKIDDKKIELDQKGKEPDPEPGKPKRRYTKKEAFVLPTPDESAIEAQFFLEFIGKMRETAGITKAMPEFYGKMFITSYYTMACKYGPIMSRWLPELMFGGTLFLMGIDTLTELKKIKIAEAKETQVKKEQETQGLAPVIDLDAHIDTDKGK